jgi:hypothetical protein
MTTTTELIMAISHAGHNHPATPAGRRACRNGASPAPVTTDYIADHMRKVQTSHAAKARMDRDYDAAEIKITGPVARRMARQAVKADNARIQPRRSGARVSATNTSCVQAALHIDAHGGRCACGWAAAS